MDQNFVKQSVFTTHLFLFDNLPLAVSLREYIKGLAEVDGIASNVAPTMKKNLVESKFDFLSADQQIIGETRKFFASCLKTALNDLYKSNYNYKIRFNESWYHIGQKNSSHDTHMHPNCSWCGVFYLDIGDENGEGATKFKSPISLSYVDHGTTNLNEETIAVKPSNGRLVLFPSYLYHYQSLYIGEAERIVVAFNSSVLGKLES